MTNDILTQKRLKELLHYDSETGIFRMLVDSKKYKNGDIAGYVDKDGYVQIRVDRKRIQAHRLAFLYMTGKYPSVFVDHKNGIRNDNSWENIREADTIENTRNAKKRKDNTSGYKGVNSYRNKWEARCRTENGRKHLGYFKTAEDAYLAYMEFSKNHFGEFYTSR
jgi:hypothetical protein